MVLNMGPLDWESSTLTTKPSLIQTYIPLSYIIYMHNMYLHILYIYKRFGRLRLKRFFLFVEDMDHGSVEDLKK